MNEEESVIPHNQSHIMVQPNMQDTSAFIASRLNIIDDLLNETFIRKQSLTDANQEYLNRYLAVFQENASQIKQKRKVQKQMIEQLAKINEANKDLERKNMNLDKDILHEARL